MPPDLDQRLRQAAQGDPRACRDLRRHINKEVKRQWVNHCRNGRAASNGNGRHRTPFRPAFRLFRALVHHQLLCSSFSDKASALRFVQEACTKLSDQIDPLETFVHALMGDPLAYRRTLRFVAEHVVQTIQARKWSDKSTTKLIRNKKRRAWTRGLVESLFDEHWIQLLADKSDWGSIVNEFHGRLNAPEGRLIDLLARTVLSDVDAENELLTFLFPFARKIGWKSYGTEWVRVQWASIRRNQKQRNQSPSSASRRVRQRKKRSVDRTPTSLRKQFPPDDDLLLQEVVSNTLVKAAGIGCRPYNPFCARYGDWGAENYLKKSILSSYASLGRERAEPAYFQSSLATFMLDARRPVPVRTTRAADRAASPDQITDRKEKQRAARRREADRVVEELVFDWLDDVRGPCREAAEHQKFMQPFLEMVATFVAQHIFVRTRRYEFVYEVIAHMWMSTRGDIDRFTPPKTLDQLRSFLVSQPEILLRLLQSQQQLKRQVTVQEQRAGQVLKEKGKGRERAQQVRREIQRKSPPQGQQVARRLGLSQSQVSQLRTGFVEPYMELLPELVARVTRESGMFNELFEMRDW